MKNRFFVVVLLCAVIAVGLSACGGDDEKSNLAEITNVVDVANGNLAYTRTSGSNTWTRVYAKSETLPTAPTNVTVQITKSDKSTGPATATLNLAEGTASTTVEITAEDGKTKKTWTISASVSGF